MALIEGQITINEVDVLEVDSNPGAGAGTPAPVGSLAIEQDEINSEGRLYQKTGPLDTDWSEFISSIAGDLPVVQARRTTPVSDTPLSWVDIDFDTTDVQNDIDIIEHLVSTNPERILVKDSGIYRFDYGCSIDLPDTGGDQQYDFRLIKNGTNEIPGSTSRIDDSVNTFSVANYVYVILAAGDEVSLQIQSPTGGSATLLENFTFSGSRYRGTRGEKGATGSGSNINLEQDGAPVTGSPFDTLNFQNATVIDAGSGTANISSNTVFGSEQQDARSEAESSTTSSAYQQKLRLTTTNLPLGKYRIGWYCEGSNSSASGRFQMRVQIDDSSTLCEHSHEDEDSRDRVAVAGHDYIENLSGVINIDMDYREQQGGTARIRRARLEIWRVS